MASSGTWNFQLSNTAIIFDAFDRIQVNPETIDQRKMRSAGVSLNLELLEWSNRGFNFWETTSGTIALAVNQATYQLPANLVVMTELYYTVVNGGGAGINQDRFMVPMTRTEYAQVTNKLEPGVPTRYWFQMLRPPQVTVWEVPQSGQVAPEAVLSWYGLQQIQDANPSMAETPDVAYRAIEALITGMALRLCEKFGPSEPQARTAMMTEKKMLADNAWNNMVRRDQEPGDILIRPGVHVYGRLR